MKEFNKNRNERRGPKRSGRGDFRGSDRRDSRRSDRRDFSGRNFRRSNRRSEPKEMHKVVCDECKKECEVPFRPTPGKPIYCEECFKARGKSGNNQDGLAKINEKLDKIMKALEIE